MSLIPFAGAVQKFNRPRDTGYRIERSLRFNSADSAHLSRTPAGAGNRKTWTWSGWVKRCNSATTNSLFAAYVDANNFFLIHLREDGDNGRFEAFNYSSTYDWVVQTNAVLRDPSAWYHLVVALDTTQATDTNRIKMYVNGVLQSFASATYPSLNFDSDANNNIAHYIGQDGESSRYHNGYMTEIHFIDGQALTPTSFGEFNEDTGIWQPKAYEGEYGTNGFYLDFSDNSGTTSSTLGKDQAGSNDWTPNNFSVTAGAGNDSLVDSPTRYGTDTGAGGQVRGNYATLNPLKQTGASLTNGNLQFTKSGGAGASLFTIHPTFFVNSGKWYFEVTPTAINTNGSLVGIVGTDVALATYASLGSMTGNIWAWRQDSYKVNNGSDALYGNTWTTNDVIGVAVDMDNGKIWFSKNGTFQASGDPAAGTNATFTNVSGSVGPLLIDQGISGTFDGSINAGQRPFANTAPEGFKALCTTNLPEPTIADGGEYFGTLLWTGDGTSGRTIATGQSGVTGTVDFTPDLTWIKERNNVRNHLLTDILRGGTAQLRSNTTDAESQFGDINLSFTDGGFINAGSSSNESSNTFVAWNWNAGGSTVINTDGTISSNVRANPTAGFSIVTYTGTGANTTVGHGLGIAPSMVIVKNRNVSARGWVVWHTGLSAANKVIVLNSTAAEDTSTTSFQATIPTSSVVYLGTDSWTNNSSDTYVMYAFAPVAGYSAFGSYTGNGSTDGPFVYTGFRPACIILKVYDGTANWLIHDNKRNTYNVVDKKLFPNASDAEATADVVDFLSNGFKLRGTNTQFNGNGYNYIYAAFAENPFAYSLAR